MNEDAAPAYIRLWYSTGYVMDIQSPNNWYSIEYHVVQSVIGEEFGMHMKHWRNPDNKVHGANMWPIWGR